LTAVLLLHGQPGGVRDWDRVVAALDGVDAFAVHRPGWDGASAPRDLPGNAAAAVAALDERGCAGAVVVGHSLGAGVAAWMAVLYPERVRALVLASPSVNTAALDRFDRLLAAPVAGAMLSACFMAGVGSVLAVPEGRRLVARRLGLDEGFLRAGSRLLRRRSAWRSFAVEQRALFRDLPALEQRLGSIAAPTFIVSGAADWVVPPAAARLLATEISGAELELVPGAGHLLPHQHPEVVASVIRRTLALASPYG
jgi:pimeloyl-ACP methyl ester carboxylesterase